MHYLSRRQLLSSSAIMLLMSSPKARASIVKGGLPWKPGSADPPTLVTPGGWHYFTPKEAAAVEAMVDRLIPPDPETPGGKDAAAPCSSTASSPARTAELAAFICGPVPGRDQAAGSAIAADAGAAIPPRACRARKACHGKFAGKGFAQLAADQKDEVIKGLETARSSSTASTARASSSSSSPTPRNGFLADPIYGGNKDMAAWKMIGFPGAHYDYRDWIERHNERVTLPPVGIGGHPNWSQ